MSEEELIALLKKNDSAAMEAIFRQYHASLCSVAFRIVRDKDQAKDIVQEVFIKVWRNRSAIQITTSLGFYLKRATINTALNHSEGNLRITKEPLQEVHRVVSVRDSDPLTQQELQQAVDQALCKLPVRTRAVFTLIRSEEMSYRQVAESLNISEKAVEKEMMKALRLLRDALRPYLTSMIILIHPVLF
jgi:RNA polymerase sigma-70 factor, ECF subfamily